MELDSARIGEAERRMDQIEDALRCGDCIALPGEPHAEACDIARCLWTGGQRFSCSLSGEDHDCGKDIWTGQWPGEADAIRLGWHCRRKDIGYESCAPDDPGALPDINRLFTDARWNRAEHRWELPDTPSDQSQPLSGQSAG